MKGVYILAIVAVLVSFSDGSSYNDFTDFCTFYAAKPVCDEDTKYRTINGFCNNLRHPKWGAENAFYNRLLSPRYADGVSEFIGSVKGGPLPNPRQLSLVLHGNKNISSNENTLIYPFFGQYVAEDLGSNADIFIRRNCCRSGIPDMNPDPMCKFIPLKSTDPTFPFVPRLCMNFLKTSSDLYENCPGTTPNGQPSNQINSVTAYLDHSGIYGNNDIDVKRVRSFRDGLLKVKRIYGADYPPFAPSVCLETEKYDHCYLGGDFRMNEQPGLASIHILFIREHNRIAKELKKLNCEWNDEKLFQEARRINIAQLQYITYYEYFPIILGKWTMRKNLLIFNGCDRANDYDPEVDVGFTNEFAGAAYRFFHTMIPDGYDLYSADEKINGNLALKDIYLRPSYLQYDDNMDRLVRGMSRQPAGAADNQLSDGVRENLFRTIQPIGIDLKALDIQRGRDHGMGSYNDAREYCGLPRASTWSDFSDDIAQSDIDNLKAIYKHPDDVELVNGGSLEKLLPDTLLGRTFHCITMKQLYNTRVGDRFWFETDDDDIRFTSYQLKQIRKASFSRIICDNGRDIENMQRHAFILPSKLNPIIKCDHIPRPKLSAWKKSD